MSLKRKLFIAMGMFCLTIVLLIAGVWAVSSTQISLGGKISFTATNVFATVSGKIEGIKESVNILPLKYSATSSPTEAELKSWNNDISFAEGNLITYTITITNHSSDRSMFIIVVDNCDIMNMNKTIKKNGVEYESGKEFELVSEATVIYTISMSIDNLDKSLEERYSFNVILRDVSEEEKEIATIQGDQDSPVIITEKDAQLFNINYKGEPNLSVHYPNRFNIQAANFVMGSYQSTHIITKENNGITITTEEQNEVRNAVHASYQITAENSGKIWLSCEAEADENVSDIGMRLKINDDAQYLCRGEGLLIESAEVQKGDTITIMLYARIQSSAANVLKYKNIMLSYGSYVDYVPFKEDQDSYVHLTKTIVLNGGEDITWETTTTLATTQTATEEKYYGFKYTLDTTGVAEGVLPTSNDLLANVEVEGAELQTYNNVYKNNVGIGISSTGIIFLYVGPGFNRSALAEYLVRNPITITFDLKEQQFVGINNYADCTTGTIITSDSDFSASYTYVSTEKVAQLVCFGDSITGQATNDSSYSSIIDRTTDIEVFNVGFSGTRWTDHSNANYIPFSMNRLADAVCDNDFTLQDEVIESGSEVFKERLAILKSVDFSQVEYISMCFGTNDWYSGVALKSQDDNSASNKQRSNIEDSIKYCVEKFREAFPHIKIIILTPYWFTFDSQDTDNVPNAKGDYLDDYVSYIEEISSSLNVESVINLYQSLDINFSNYGNYLYDGVHPNERLNNILAEILTTAIKK